MDAICKCATFRLTMAQLAARGQRLPVNGLEAAVQAIAERVGHSLQAGHDRWFPQSVPTTPARAGAVEVRQ